ncbi:hypothetical protein GCM10010508_57140 [Streptomyces naganishii JCM 4654]|uniref:DUF397 domain-containing protein n=1 Tax=Streptomyces naganishii JCM 4654 TaxID=1306179 RepID=A0A919CYD9_9ACTN|nr:hypothetical protein GCM10010508_57140 [Streptomyces naganishii JCM 4654]
MSELKWFKSSFSEASGNACVEIAISDEDGDVAIRNSTCPQLTIRTSRAAFAALVTHLRTTSPG